MKIETVFPCVEWGRHYNRGILTKDLVASIIVTIMLIPQSLAYALLAGLPPETGLYASIGPLLAYTVFGTSRTLAVGPVAVVSLMTAVAVGQVASPGSAEYLGAAMILALLSGLFLLLMGIFRLGFLANLLSHPVISGFITASGILIAASQLKHIFGISASGHSLLNILSSQLENIQDINIASVFIGVFVISFLLYVRSSLKLMLLKWHVNAGVADGLTKAGPVLAVFVSTIVVAWFGLSDQGVKVVGIVPQGLPGISFPTVDFVLWQELLPAAIMISLIGFVESISVGQTLAAKRRQRITPNQELIGLGTANLASAISGGYPVTGGFSRSVVNFDAGAQTPMAGAFTAMSIALTTLFLTPLFQNLPIATLAGTIIVAVLSLIDLNAIKRIWIYSKSDFAAMSVTILATLGYGVETGVMTGVLTSVLLHLWRTSRPHIAIVGLVPGTHHFRNIERHKVQCSDTVLSVRVDESLFFANARYLEDTIYQHVADNKNITDLVLMCAAVNEIDGSALETLESINASLKTSEVQLHLSEVKGPVMDRLARSHFLEQLTGEIFLDHYTAVVTLDPNFELTPHPKDIKRRVRST